MSFNIDAINSSNPNIPGVLDPLKNPDSTSLSIQSLAIERLPQLPIQTIPLEQIVTLIDPRPTPTLEQQFLEEIVSIDLDTPCNFADYLAPNEKHPIDAQPHLAMEDCGLIVSTGTERSLFDFILSDEEKCTGLVAIDINPKVKAYLDFNVLLLRLAINREDYCQLAFPPQALGKERIETLRQRIKDSPCIPQELKPYYSKHLEAFAKVFDTTSHQWTQNPSFSEVNYYTNDKLFNRLQTAARSGKIIAKTGSIDELSFLKNKKIAIVDISNISDYTCLNFKSEQPPQKIVYTSCKSNPALYASEHYNPISSEEHQEISRILNMMSQIYDAHMNDTYRRVNLALLATYDPPRKQLFPLFHSKKLFDSLKSYEQKYLLQIPQDSLTPEKGKIIDCNPQAYASDGPLHCIKMINKYLQDANFKQDTAFQNFLHEHDSTIRNCVRNKVIPHYASASIITALESLR
jgi:hypothetical protein